MNSGYRNGHRYRTVRRELGPIGQDSCACDDRLTGADAPYVAANGCHLRIRSAPFKFLCPDTLGKICYGGRNLRSGSFIQVQLRRLQLQLRLRGRFVLRGGNAADTDQATDQYKNQYGPFHYLLLLYSPYLHFSSRLHT